MKVRIGIVVLVAGIVLLGGCTRPRVIPDEKLVEILKEIYLDNAYAAQTHLNTDSLDIYGPILKKYGYKPRDLNYTFNDFSKRKSSRISDVIEAAIVELDQELQWYSDRVAVLDTINLIARERLKQLVVTDSLIAVNRIADTAKLRIELPAAEGTYDIRYSYRIDSADLNPSLRTTHVLFDSAGRQVGVSSNWMRVHQPRQTYAGELVASAAARRLEIRFGNYGKELKTPRMQIDSVVIIRYLPQQQALDSLRKHLYAYRLVIDGTEYPQDPQDRGALSVLPPGLAPERDSLP